MKQIAFFDIESTGVSVSTDKIIEITIIKGEHVNEDFLNRQEFTARINPGIPIPPESIEVHGITDEMVKDCHIFNFYAEQIEKFLEGCDLGGFNILRFDIPMLAEHLFLSGKTFSLEGRKIIDVFACYKKLRPQSLEAAYAEFVSPDGFQAHNALADVEATIKVLNSMIRNKKVPSGSEEIEKFAFEEIDIVDFAGKFKRKDGVIILNFGKHRGEPAEQHLDFLQWMMGKDFTQDTISWCEHIIEDYDSTQYELRTKHEPF